jgi:hypothetical protein
MLAVMMPAACNVASAADAFLVPRNLPDALALVRRYRSTEAEVVLS